MFDLDKIFERETKINAPVSEEEAKAARDLFADMSAVSDKQKAYAEDIVWDFGGYNPQMVFPLPKALRVLKAIENGEYDDEIEEELEDLGKNGTREDAIDVVLGNERVLEAVLMIANRKNAGKVISASQSYGKVARGETVYGNYIKSL